MQIAGRVSEELGKKIEEAQTRFGVTEGAIVRMAVEEFMPGYLAAQGRVAPADLAERAELIALADQIGMPAAVEALRKKLRAAAPRKEAA